MARIEATLQTNFEWLTDQRLAESESHVQQFSGETLCYELPLWSGLATQRWAVANTLLGWQSMTGVGHDLEVRDRVPIAPSDAEVSEKSSGGPESPTGQPDTPPLTPHRFGFEGVGPQLVDAVPTGPGADSIIARHSDPIPLPLLETFDPRVLPSECSGYRNECTASTPMIGVAAVGEEAPGSGGGDVIQFAGITGPSDRLPVAAVEISSAVESGYGDVLTSDSNLSGYVTARTWGVVGAVPNESVTSAARHSSSREIDSGDDTDALALHANLSEAWAETYVVLSPPVNDI